VVWTDRDSQMRIQRDLYSFRLQDIGFHHIPFPENFAPFLTPKIFEHAWQSRRHRGQNRQAKTPRYYSNKRKPSAPTDSQIYRLFAVSRAAMLLLQTILTCRKKLCDNKLFPLHELCLRDINPRKADNHDLREKMRNPEEILSNRIAGRSASSQ